jgi:hypothetical protein
VTLPRQRWSSSYRQWEDGPTGPFFFDYKTELLTHVLCQMSLLGEMTLTQGRIIMSKNPSKRGLAHSISYAAQTLWLRYQSLKDDILFGYPYDEERYNAVIECCAMTTDLENHEDGDTTEIGARSVEICLLPSSRGTDPL